MTNMCMHCLEEGYWEDEDKCIKCAVEGHVSPWRVSQCPACNAEFFKKMAELRDGINSREKMKRKIKTESFLLNDASAQYYFDKFVEENIKNEKQIISIDIFSHNGQVLRAVNYWSYE